MTTTPKDPRVRSWWFLLTGALGGLAGWGLAEIARGFGGDATGVKEEMLNSAFYFAGFGLMVGAAIGLTEGWVRKDRKRLLYGLWVGLILGGVGGAMGGALGQAFYGLYPHKYAGKSRTDLALVLDSSSSMRSFFIFGNDPWGKRRKAAERLIDRLSPNDRVTVVDFDHQAELLLPLTRLDDDAARREARRSVSRIDSTGGTHLSAGLRVALDELLSHPSEGRDRVLLFLTDGMDSFGGVDPTILKTAVGAEIPIHTVGLGADIDPAVLQDIADRTGGSYYPVEHAGDLIAVFDRIYTRSSGAMTEYTETSSNADDLLTPQWVLLTLRVLSWAAVGWLIGLGQGIRENTREDLRACGLGGLLGGGLGGALFQVVGPAIGLQAGLVGRLAADVIVGAFIGGTMRVAQDVAGTDRKATTTLLAVLPEKSTAVSIRRRA